MQTPLCIYVIIVVQIFIIYKILQNEYSNIVFMWSCVKKLICGSFCLQSVSHLPHKLPHKFTCFWKNPFKAIWEFNYLHKWTGIVTTCILHMTLSWQWAELIHGQSCNWRSFVDNCLTWTYSKYKRLTFPTYPKQQKVDVMAGGGYTL
jgi:hypothetical protein